MEAPCLAHKFERLQTTSDGPRPDIRPNLLREGEVSPFKICVTILLREHYSLQQTTIPPPEQRITALKCLYDLVSIPDLTFQQFKQTMQDPDHCFRIEVVQSVLSILQELDRNNVGFLNDFANTMIEINETSSSVIILKKKIGKNGVFGRFVRMVLMSIRKMSYAQTVHAYRELCLYVGLAYKIYDKDKKPSEVPAVGEMKPPVLTLAKEVVTMEQDGEPTTIIRTENVTDECAMLEQTLSDTQISDEEDGGGGTDMSISMMQDPTPSKLVFPSASTSSVGLGAEVEVKTILSTPASITKPIGFIFDRMEKMVPYDASLAFNAQTLTAPTPNKENAPKYGLDAFEEMRKARVERNTLGLGPALSTNFVHRLERLKSKPPESEEARLQRSIYSDATAMDVDQAIGSNREGGDGSENDEVNSNPKWWSRKLVESTIKMATHAMEYDLGPRKYSAKNISTFVEHAKSNPSAKVLLPQLHFLDYMNSLEIKDISRAHESLRTSFDLRIKPTTSELSKAIPYASYNFAVFYDRLGYKKDSKMFLEEAFQSGHSSADETCLEYCHNLWSQFEGVTLKDLPRAHANAKDAAKGISNLQTIRAIAGVMERLRSGGSSQLELLNDLYKCMPAGSATESSEILTAEALQMEALIAIYMTFGWYHWARMACEVVLDLAEDFDWPANTYCAAVCTLGHINLIEGEVEDAHKIFDTGARVFGPQTNPTGETFNTQHALFLALNAYLATEPLSDELLATLAAFDHMESMYWLSYTKMLQSDFDGALAILRKLSHALNEASALNVDLKIRCLLLQGEVYCFAGIPNTALTFNFEAQELATRANSDFYMILAKINLACVQNVLKLYNAAARTMQPLPISHLLCTSPYLKARLNIIDVKLFLGMEIHDPLDLHNNDMIDKDKPIGPEMCTFLMRLCPRPSSATSTGSGRRSSGRRPSASSSSSLRSTRRKNPASQEPDDVQKYRDGMAQGLMDTLQEADDIFKVWNNSYRKKEILYLRKQVMLELQPTHEDQMQALQEEFESVETPMIWDPKTCVV